MTENDARPTCFQSDNGLSFSVDTDSDTRLARRLHRDILDRDRDIEGVLKQYEKFVKPSFDSFIAPSMQHADIIIPRGGENKVHSLNSFLYIYDFPVIAGIEGCVPKI